MADTKKTDWRSSFKARFPQFANIIDGGAGEAEARRVFGNDLIDLVLDVAQNPGQYDFTSQEGLAAFDAKVMATKYYQQTSNTRKEFDSLTKGEQDDRIEKNRAIIASNYGDLNLTVTELNNISKDATRNGMSGIVLTQYINSIVGGRARGKQDLLESLDAQALKKIAKAYNYKPVDLEDQIVSAVTGKEYAPTGTIITADTLRQNAQRAAKATYFHLADQIDAGLTLEEIFSPYQDMAARILEKTPNEISLSDPMFTVAFGDKQNGQPTLADWERKIKSDPRYGYQYTSEANDAATTIVRSIAKAFGKLK